MKEKYVRIEWEDCAYWADTRYRSEKFYPVKIISCGFLISKEKDFCVIAQDLHDDDTCRYIKCIPMKNIISIKEIKAR